MTAVRDIHRVRNRRADASAVFLSLATTPCNMIVRFVGGSREQVLHVSSACWDPGEGSERLAA